MYNSSNIKFKPLRLNTLQLLKILLSACLLIVLNTNLIAHSADIKPFTSDGCSKFPDGTVEHKNLWLKCCTAHDVTYWAGGGYDDRLKADLELRACVKSQGVPAIAEIMLAGVRVGGSPWWPSTFRWGYGWPYTRGYAVLTIEELEQVRKQKEGQDSN